MARIELSENVTLRGARRILTKRDSAFWITRRHGKLYTIKKFSCEQPNTEAQMRCRELLMRANEMAREELAKERGRETWGKKAREMGYKTAIGCARAYYVAKLKGKELAKKKVDWKDEKVMEEKAEKVMEEEVEMVMDEKVEKVVKEEEVEGWNVKSEKKREGRMMKREEVIRIEKVVRWKSVGRLGRGRKSNGRGGDERREWQKVFC